MTTKRTATRSGLRSLGVPAQLAEEMVALRELGIDLPRPTEEVVAATLERCRETLASMQACPVPADDAGFSLVPAIAGASWGQFLGALQASVWDQGLPYAARNPAEPAIMLVDNHAVVDPEWWDADLSLTALRGVYRTAEETLQRANAGPVARVVILKDDPAAYDQRDLTVIRRAIAQQSRQSTYMISSRHAHQFRGRSYAVVGDVVFEISPAAGNQGVVVAEPLGIRDRKRVSAVRQSIVDLTQAAVRVYDGNELHPRFRSAVGSDDNERLRDVLADVMHSRV